LPKNESKAARFQRVLHPSIGEEKRERFVYPSIAEKRRAAEKCT
jgi:hypothetical protein